MFGDGSLTFREFAMNEPLPMATIHQAVLEYMQGRDDAVVFGAHAVNAYVELSRMTQDVDILALDAETFAENLKQYLANRFHIAIRIRDVAKGNGYRLYQVRNPANRHLVDVRMVESLPACKRIEGVLFPEPVELISQKMISMVTRLKTAKGMTDTADLRRLLLTFPELKSEQGPVLQALNAANASSAVLDAWSQIVVEDIEPDDDDAF